MQGRGRSLRFQDWPQDERGEWESLCGGSRSQKDVSGPRSGPAAFGKSSWESDEGDVSGWEQDTPGVGRENRGLTVPCIVTASILEAFCPVPLCFFFSVLEREKKNGGPVALV